MNNTTNSTPSSNVVLKTLPIIHFALFVGQTLFAIVAYSISEERHFGIKSTGDKLYIIVPVCTIVGLVASNIMFQKLLQALVSKENLKEKLKKYQSALILKYALLEMPSLLGIVAFLMTGNLFYLVFTGLVVMYFASIKPTRERMESDLRLNFENMDS